MSFPRFVPVILAFAAAAVLATAAPASAATDPTLHYEGSGTSSGGGSFEFVVDVDCSSDPCTVAASIPATSYSVTGAVPLLLVGGEASGDFPAHGDLCDPTATSFVGASSVHLSVDGGTAELSVATSASDHPGQCDHGEYQGSFDIHQDAGQYGGTATLVSGDVCVLDDSCPTPTPTASPAAPAGGAGNVGHRDFSQPNVLSTLPTAAQAITVPNALWAAATTVVLVLLIAFPTQLFNSASERASAALGAWWRRRTGRTESRDKRPVALRTWPLAAAGVAAAGVISAFVDPGFALDAAGWRALLSILISFAIEVVLGWFAVILLVRRVHPTATARFEFQPLSLLVVVAAVLLSRLSGFQPGIVFGLVAGVAFGGVLATAEKARTTLIGVGWAFGVGVVAWVVYSVLPPDAVFVRETLAAASIAGMAALPIALLPARGLAGHAVWEWRRPVWIAAYAIGVFAFMLVLLPLPASWAAVGVSVWTWAGLYLAYALAAVAVWLVVTRPWKVARAS